MAQVDMEHHCPPPHRTPSFPTSSARTGLAADLKKPDPDKSAWLSVSWGNVVSSGSENAEGLPLPAHFLSGLQHFLMDEV